MKKEEKSFFSFKFEEPEPKRRRLPKRLRAARPPDLTIGQILEWADAHHARKGKWPNVDAGPVHDNRNEKWRNIDLMLRLGRRGLPAGSSLARLLIEKRGAHFTNCQPPLTETQILDLADDYKRRTGDWPSLNSDEKWSAIDGALRVSLRSLPGGSSLACLLQEHRGRRNPKNLPSLTIRQILGWADAHFRRTGHWPTAHSGPVEDVDGESWETIDVTLSRGGRGLAGGSSLARLFAKHRGHRNPRDLPSLTARQVLGWADAHFRRVGSWPSAKSGPIKEAPGERWNIINAALSAGSRGLPKGKSLAQFLEEHRGRRNRMKPPSLTVGQILAWADGHFRRTGRWPTVLSGPVENVPGENWHKVNYALRFGIRGLPGGSSLPRLLEERRGRRNHLNRPTLTEKQILAWADNHFRRTGRWPAQQSGPIEDSSGDSWAAIENALTRGGRGLRGGSSLARLLDKHRRESPAGA